MILRELISTSGFQSGAIQYAQEHGIALLHVMDKILKFCVATEKSTYEKYKAEMIKKYNNTPDFFFIWENELMEIEDDLTSFIDFLL